MWKSDLNFKQQNKCLVICIIIYPCKRRVPGSLIVSSFAIRTIRWHSPKRVNRKIVAIIHIHNNEMPNERPWLWILMVPVLSINLTSSQPFHIPPPSPPRLQITSTHVTIVILNCRKKSELIEIQLLKRALH